MPEGVCARSTFDRPPPRVRDPDLVLTTGLTARICLIVSFGGDNRNHGRVSSMRAKIFSATSAAVLLSLLSLDSASAEGGCGPGFHRGPYGGCRPNRGPVVVVPAAPIVVAPAAV